MTTPTAMIGRRQALSPRQRIAVGTIAATSWAVSQAGLRGDIVNTRGWSSFSEFWAALASPTLTGEFLELTVDAATITLSFAVLGTVLSLLIGVVGSLALSELVTGRGWVWRIARATLVIPRAVHEILWALLLIQIFGFDPLVAVLAIGLPFGAVTAKVFAETIDEADPEPYHALRATGAGRIGALAYGIAPTISGELASYSFYRFECAIRSAAVLGVIGAGGLGFQLDLSFESLRYHEIWTLVVALMILSGLADAWSSAVRRSKTTGLRNSSVLLISILVPLSWRWVGLDMGHLWSHRTRRLAGDLVADLLPTRLGPGGYGELLEACADTVAMSILALCFAGVGGLAIGILSSRPTGRAQRRTRRRSMGRLGANLVLLLFRAVPAPIWAFVMVLILFPGLWPGAVALGVYNLGVLGRLFAEALEEQDTAPTDSLLASGASPAQAFLYGTLPTAAPRLISLALYRWEVIVRETIVVGVVGAGGLGQLINEHLAARDFAAVAGAIGALIVISIAIDSLSAVLRRALR